MRTQIASRSLRVTFCRDFAVYVSLNSLPTPWTSLNHYTVFFLFFSLTVQDDV